MSETQCTNKCPVCSRGILQKARAHIKSSIGLQVLGVEDIDDKVKVCDEGWEQGYVVVSF